MRLLKTFFLKIAVLGIFLFFRFSAIAQSNEGTDFWVAYTGHVDGKASRLTLFITSKVNATVTIDVGGTPYAGGPVQVIANQSIPVYIDPNIYGNVYVDQSDGIAQKHGIHVMSTAKIVLYSHISRGARSAATLVLPTMALGNEYYAMAYNQMPSATGANPEYRVSEFTVVAVEDNTTLEISLPTDVNSISNPSHLANTTFTTPVLNKGDVYQFQSTKDVTGVKIRTVGNCTPIAVFSGSTKVGFCEEPNSIVGTGQDNLYQQLFPLTSWVKITFWHPFTMR